MNAIKRIKLASVALVLTSTVAFVVAIHNMDFFAMAAFFLFFMFGLTSFTICRLFE